MTRTVYLPAIETTLAAEHEWTVVDVGSECNKHYCTNCGDDYN